MSKKHAKAPAAPINPLQYKAKMLTTSKLRQNRTPAALGEVGELIETAMEAQSAQIQQDIQRLYLLQNHPRMACKKGCAHCCYTQVVVKVPELVRLVNHIKGRWTEEEINLLLGQLRSYVERIAAMGSDREPTACPLLVDDCCSVHFARPLVCRGFNSVDVKVCIAARENWRQPPGIPGVSQQVASAVVLYQGMGEGLRECRLRDENVEMAPALEILLRDETAIERWIEGEDVFAQVRVGRQPA